MMDLPYYPKLQGCVPFSPVPGPRLLTIKSDQKEGTHSKAVIQKTLGMALIQLMGESGLESNQMMELHRARALWVDKYHCRPCRAGLHTIHWHMNCLSALHQHQHHIVAVCWVARAHPQK